MKFSCSKDQLVHAVQVVQKAVSNKPQMPILSGIYINAQPDCFEIQATDYEIGISCKIEGLVTEPGAIVLSGRYFQEVVKRLPGDNIEIYTNKEDNTVKLISLSAQFNLLSLPADEFPVLYPLIGETNFTIRDNILRDLIKKTVFAASNDEARPVFTGALLEVVDSEVLMVATNTHRLALKKENLDNITNNIKVIIPSKILNELARIMVSEIPSPIKITCHHNQISFSFDNIYIISRIIEGQFPDYQRVIPPNFATTVAIKTADFSSAVERVSLISRDGDYNVVKLAFRNNEILITSNNPEVGKAEEAIAANIEGNELEIAFNAKYIVDILKNIDDEKIFFTLNTPLSPASIKPENDENYNYIITPVRSN